jgi:hypothetical protein
MVLSVVARRSPRVARQAGSGVAVLLAAAMTFVAPPAVWAAAPAASVSCDRACLKAVMAGYVAALLRKDPSALPLAQYALISENNRPTPVGQGLWTTFVKFYSSPSNTQYVIDAGAGQVALMGVIDVGVPALYAVRLKVVDGRISEIESLIKREADPGGPFQPEGFLWREAPYIRTLAPPLATSRARLRETADTYWRVGTTTHKGDDVPYTVDCVHIENGMNTDWERPLTPLEEANPQDNPASSFDGRIWTCEREVNLTTRAWTKVRGNHFLIDEERGLVMDWNLVDRGGAGGGKPPPQTLPDGSPNHPPEYGPPTRGPDGWPREPLGTPRSGRPAPMSAAAPTANYHAALFRIVKGKIAREQQFWISVPMESKPAFPAP